MEIAGNCERSLIDGEANTITEEEMTAQIIRDRTCQIRSIKPVTLHPYQVASSRVSTVLSRGTVRLQVEIEDSAVLLSDEHESKSSHIS